jgi:hypothetical protein
MRLIGVLSKGETLSSSDAADGLEALNAMLDSWRNERMMAYAIKDESLTLVATQSSYTIGTGGDLSTTRPVRIEGAYVRSSDIDYPVEMLDAKQWAAIEDKTSTSDWPDYAYYQPTMSTGTLYVYPVPTAGNTLHVLTWTPFTAFALADTVTLPPGYEEAMATNLAPRLAPEYGVSVSAEVVAMARDSKANIKRVNSVVPKLTTALGAMFGPVTSNILTGL